MANTDTRTKEELVQKLYRSAPILAGALAAIVVAALAFWGYTEYQAKKEREVQAELYAFEKQIEDIEKNLYDEALKEQTKDTVKKQQIEDLPQVDKTPETFEKNFASVSAELEKAIEKNAGTKAAAVSTIFLADKYSEYGLTEKAKGLLAKAKSATQDKVLAALLSLQNFAHADTAEQCQQLNPDLDKITTDASLKFLWGEAYLRKAACAWTAGNKEEAEKALTKLTTDFGDSSAAKRAQVLHRLIVLKSRDAAQAGQ